MEESQEPDTGKPQEEEQQVAVPSRTGRRLSAVSLMALAAMQSGMGYRLPSRFRAKEPREKTAADEANIEAAKSRQARKEEKRAANRVKSAVGRQLAAKKFLVASEEAPADTVGGSPSPVEAAFDRIAYSGLYRLDGEPIDLPQALLDLATAIKAEGEVDWNRDEFGPLSLQDAVIAGYWVLTQWHAGQASVEYRAMCALGQIYKPGPSVCSAAQEGESVGDAYQVFDRWFEMKYGGKTVKTDETPNVLED